MNVKWFRKYWSVDDVCLLRFYYDEKLFDWIFYTYYSELGWGIKGEGRNQGEGTLCETTLSVSRLFLRLCASESSGSFIRKVSCVTALRSLFLDGLMADNNSDERRLDPRIYYDLPLNSLKPSVLAFLFIFFFFIWFKIQLTVSPSNGEWCRRDIFSSSHQVHHQFIATDCVRIHVDIMGPR